MEEQNIVATVDTIVRKRGVASLSSECVAEALLDLVEWMVKNNADSIGEGTLDRLTTAAVHRVLNREHTWSRRHRYLLTQDDFMASRFSTLRQAFANLTLEEWGKEVREGKRTTPIGHWLDFLAWKEEKK